MADFKKSFELEASVTGGDQAASKIDELQAAIDELFATGKITQDKLAELSKSLLEFRNAAASGAGGARQLPKELQDIAKEAAKAEAALKKMSVEDIGLGKSGDVSGRVGEIDPQQLQAVEQLANYYKTGVLPALKETRSESERLKNAEKALAKAREDAKKSSVMGTQDSVAAAKEREVKATNELEAAERRLAAVKRDSASSDNQLIAATNDVTEARKNLTSATNDHERANQQLTNSLPRTRYALYDVSRSLTLVGAALVATTGATAALSVKMSRDFANVIRTTETFADSTGLATRVLRNEFEALFTSMPTDWSNLTDLGALAGQMDIAANSVASFSETVTKFSASTGMTVEASATALGRLSKLLNVAAGDYDNLMSSILAVGTNSVATEAQIIAISEQIVGIASTAGFAADEVVGLSSAFASIGTAPELTRGIVTRFFTNIMTATTEGGERLEAFASTAGMTAAQFSRAWGDDAAGAFQALIQGLGQLEGHEALSTLKELGITQVRDIPVVLKMSQNYDLLAQSLDIANQGFVEGTLLNEHYGVIANETASKLTVLKNNFSLLLKNLGEFANTSAVKALIDMLSGIVRGIADLAATGPAKLFIGIGLAITAAVGPITLLGAAFTRATASGFGLKTVLVDLAANMRGVSTQADLANMSMGRLIGTIRAGGLQGAVGSIAGIFKGGLGIGLAVTAGVTALGYLSNKLMESKREADALKQSFRDMAGSLQDAIKQDTADWQKALAEGNDRVANSFRTVELAARETSSSNTEVKQSFLNIIGATGETILGLDGVTKSAEAATIALGKNFQAALVNTLLENDKFIDALMDESDALDTAGFKLNEYANALAKGTGSEYVQALRDRQEALLAESNTLGLTTDETIAYELGIIKVINALKGVAGPSAEFESGLSRANLQTQIGSALLAEFTDDLDELPGSFAAATAGAEDFVTQITGFSSGAHDLQGAFYDISEAAIKAGGDFSEFSAEGRAATSALKSSLNELWKLGGEDAGAFAVNVAQAFAYAEGAGADLTAQSDVLYNALATAFFQPWGLQVDTRAANESIESFIQRAINAIKVRAELEREAIAALQANRVGLDNWAAASGDPMDDYRNKQLEASKANLKTLESQIKALENLKVATVDAGKAGAAAGPQIRKGLEKAGGGAKKAAKDVKDAADKIKEEIRTLADYASDISSIFGRAFEIQFDPGRTADDITLALLAIEKRFADAEQRVRDLRNTLRGFKADVSGLKAAISKQEYLLSIALEFGDTARAEQLQADLAKTQADLASKQEEVTKTSKDLARAQEETSRTTKGNSETAIQNRRDLEDLTKKYGEHITALASSGLTGEDLRKKVEKLTGEFKSNATQLGFSKDSVKTYESSLKGLTEIIKKVPTNISVKANTNPATQALNEWLAKNKSKELKVKLSTNKPNVSGTVSGGQYKPSSIYSAGPLSVPKVTSRNASELVFFNAGGGGGGYARMQMRASGGPIYRAQGGVSGLHPGFPKGTDTVPAWLTPGEWVIKRSSVNYYGNGMMSALNNREIPRQYLQAGAAAASRGRAAASIGVQGPVDLSVSTIQAIARAVRPMLAIGDKVIAGANRSEAVRATVLGKN